MEIRKFIITLVSKFDGKGFKEADKEGKDLAKTADKVSKSFDRMAKSEQRAAAAAEKAAKKMAKAGEETEKAGKKTEKAGKRTEKAGKDIRKAFLGTATDSDLLASAIDREFKKVGARFKKVGAQVKNVGTRLKTAGTQIKALGPLATGAATALAAVGAAGLLVATGVIKTGVSFESLRARLKTVEGSAEGAKKAFADIQSFTKATPFQLEEVTTAFVRLKSLGLDASKESLSSFGNIAAAQGKPIIDIIEAVADASVGEFERLKEFGIKASSQGDKVAFTFKGTTTTIKKNSGDIQEFLQGLGETEFAGAMGDQMATAAGAISNLQDKFSTFLDEVAQLGVLQEFKDLLADLSGIAGEGEGGFAKILADGLVRAIRAVREALSQITKDDIEETLRAGVEAAKAFRTALGFLADALRFIVDVSGGADKAIVNLTLAVVALSAAFMGPAGLVVAAGAIGATIGNLLNEFFDASGAVEALLENITGLKKELASLDAEKHGNRGAPELPGGPIKKEQTFDLAEAAAADARKKAQGLGLSEGATEFFAQQAREDVRAEVSDGAAGGTGTLATFEGLQKASRGEGVGDSPLVQKAATAALEQFVGESTLAESQGKADARVAKASGKRGGKKGKKGNTFFDFNKQAEAAARTQGEKFAGQTLQQLRQEGVAVEEALAQSQEAGRTRAAELKKQFLQAGRIFDASANNILDVLGLRGPGSVLEGRPPPQSLIISIAPEINFIKNFGGLHIGEVTGTKTLEEVTGQAGQEAIEAGLEPSSKKFEALVQMIFDLQMSRLLKLDGGGTLPAGPE